jgi:hypothetical protein
VAAAFHHVPARELGQIDEPIESDVLICSDHPEATRLTSELVASMPDMRALDAGELSLATPIESFTAVLLQLNVRYKTRVAVRFTGLPDAAFAAGREDAPSVNGGGAPPPNGTVGVGSSPGDPAAAPGGGQSP